MAIRPVFIESSKPPYFKMVNIEFKWNGGFAKCQAQKNINAIHTAFLSNHPECEILEISSKSYSCKRNNKILCIYRYYFHTAKKYKLPSKISCNIQIII